jgi:serine/threonine protein kinase
MHTVEREFQDNPRLRTNVDYNEKECVFVYEYLEHDLLAMMRACLNFNLQTKKTILKEVALALNDMHNKNWIHLGKRHSKSLQS